MRIPIQALSLLVSAGASLAQAPVVDSTRTGSTGTGSAVAERTAPSAKAEDPVEQLERSRAPDIRTPRSLRAALEAIGNRAGVPVTGLWRQGDASVGLDPDRVIVVEAPSASCADALHAIADALSREGEPVTWQRARIGVEFGPRSLLWRPAAMQVRIHDVHDLLLMRPAFIATGIPAPSGGSGAGSGGGTATGSASGVEDTAVAIRRAAAQEDLVSLIQLTVEPEAWEARGGPCTMAKGDGIIVVRAPDFVHRLIECPRARARPQPPAPRASGGGRP